MIKTGDFVNLDYTGSVDNRVFDLTDEALAKKENVYDEQTRYGAVTVVVGSKQLLPGLDESLIGKKEGDSYEIEIPPEKAFGKKNPKLLKIVPQRSFMDQKINPYPGLTVNIDGIMGRVLSVSGGRVIVDFNHPLSSKILNYKVKIHKLVNDKKEQVESLVEVYTNYDKKDFDVEIKEKEAIITMKKPVHEKANKVIDEDIKKYVKLEKVTFQNPKKEEKISSESNQESNK